MTGFRLEYVRFTFVVVGVAVSGCFAKPVENVVISPARPDPTARPAVAREERESAPTLSTSVSDTTLDVQVTRRTDCQDVTSTPTVHDVETRQSTSRLGQVGNVIGALVFGVGGAAFIPGGDHPGQSAIGIFAVAIGATFVTAFVSNIMRTHDTRETIPGAPERVVFGFRACATSPLADVRLITTVGRTLFRATTGATGHVVFDLSAVEPTAELVRLPTVQVREDHYGAKPVEVDLSPSSLLPAWRATIEAHRPSGARNF